MTNPKSLKPSIQPRPTAHDPALGLLRQVIEHGKTEIESRSIAAHAAIHNLDIDASIAADGGVEARDPDPLAAQRVVVRVGAYRRRVEDDVRHGADGLLGRVLVAARAIARPRAVVRQVAREDPAVGRKWEVFSGGRGPENAGKKRRVNERNRGRIRGGGRKEEEERIQMGLLYMKVLRSTYE